MPRKLKPLLPFTNPSRKVVNNNGYFVCEVCDVTALFDIAATVAQAAQIAGDYVV